MLRALTDTSGKHRDIGLLILRLVIGFSMAAFHGWGKITGGPERWERIGGAMANLGLDFAPVFWGFMAGFAEFVASVLIIGGIFFRPALTLLIITMLVAVVRHLSIPAGEPGSGWSGASHALELLAVYVALWFTGPGRWRMARW
jgi:putative oxidoreductase